MSSSLTKTTTWSLLHQHSLTLEHAHLLDLFQKENHRFKNFSCEAAGFLIDFSKQKITQQTLSLLFSLADEQQLPKHFADLFIGKFISPSENRPVRHTALRTPFSSSTSIDHEVKQSLHRMRELVEALHTHRRVGFSGQPITDVVNLGIGGSHIGPAMAHEALWRFEQPTLSSKPIRTHFVANIHTNALEKCLQNLNPATTLFLVSSKSFTTLETITNYERAKNWLLAASNDQTAFEQHFIAITANIEQALAQGFSSQNIIPFWDWVGGRYSLWSTIGLPVAISIGMKNFEQLLAGAYAMDRHVLHAPISENAAIILALLDIWQINFHHVTNYAILAYHNDLHLLPMYLQQLIMESNGKNLDRDGHQLDYNTAPIVWGGVGTLGQHTYHQLLHQGTTHSLIDFILIAREVSDSTLQKEMISSSLSQAKVLLEGDMSSSSTHKTLSGNRPSNTIWLETLTPYSLGALIALYEHRTFAQAMLWHINPFDQWGVERGKMVQIDLQAKLDNLGDKPSLSQLADLSFF